MEPFLISKFHALSLSKSLANYLDLDSSSLLDQNFHKFINFTLNDLTKNKANELEVKFNQWVEDVGFDGFILKSSTQLTPNLSKEEHDYLSKNTTQIDEKYNLLLTEILENLKKMNTDDRKHTLVMTLHLYDPS